MSAAGRLLGGMLVLNAKRKTVRKPVRPAPDTDADPTIGHALRSVYERAVKEDVPQEMLDLLGKLK
jgi:hypothetical protein